MIPRSILSASRQARSDSYSWETTNGFSHQHHLRREPIRATPLHSSDRSIAHGFFDFESDAMSPALDEITSTGAMKAFEDERCNPLGVLTGASGEFAAQGITTHRQPKITKARSRFSVGSGQRRRLADERQHRLPEELKRNARPVLGSACGCASWPSFGYSFVPSLLNLRSSITRSITQ